MGDRHRAAIFASWIEKQFPIRKHRRVADVAGGTGKLSLRLARIGYEPTMYDKLKGWKPSTRRTRRQGTSWVKCDVEDLRFSPGQFDVVVGMHPDRATWHVIRLASEARCPFAVVPCCAVYPSTRGRVRPVRRTRRRCRKTQAGRNWMDWLKNEAFRHGFHTWCGMLDMRGQNQVLKGWLRT